MNDVRSQLGEVLASRKQAHPDSSYVAGLYSKGLNKILEKVGEECTETIIAAKDAELTQHKEDVIYETADLWFHTLVMLSHLDITPQQIIAELARRLNISGLDEKAARGKKQTTGQDGQNNDLTENRAETGKQSLRKHQIADKH